MKKKFLFIALSLTLIFSFTALPSFAASSDMVDLSSYLVNFNEEITWEYANVECPLRERVEVNMVKLGLTRPITINNYSAVYTVDFPRSTIQYADVTESSVQVIGRVYITGLLQLDTPSGFEWIYSDTKAISVTNNNQYGYIPRWTYNGEPVTFVFDLSGYDNSDIVNFQIQFEFVNQRSDNNRYSFYVRHQITEFYAAPFDIADLGNQISGAIDDQTDELLNATVDGFDSTMNNQNNAEQQLSSGFNTLSSMVERPDMTLDDLSSFTSSFGLLASGVGTIFNSLGGKFRIVWNALVFFGGAALLLGIAVPVAGLASKASRSGSKSQSFKSQKGAKKD